MRKFEQIVYNRIIERGEIISVMKSEQLTNDSTTASVPAFGYELLREVLLPELLGKDTSTILYWAGKTLARKYPLQDMNDIIVFFQQAGWGKLSVKEESKDDLELELTSELISQRFKLKKEPLFQLEAGFLAQQIETQRKVTTEAYEHPKKRADKVVFTVKWDKKDHIDLD